MSNNEDMEVDVDRGHGLQDTDDNIEGHEVRGNKAGSRDVNEKEREQLHREKGEKPGQHNKHSRQSNDENKEDWIPVRINNKQNKRKDDMAQDGMTSYHVKTGVIEVRFMKIGDKGFNVAKSLK
jgi:23S rRNA G2069 N7-methylase RlmK/C1962 C5-methylase RlmI